MCYNGSAARDGRRAPLPPAYQHLNNRTLIITHAHVSAILSPFLGDGVRPWCPLLPWRFIRSSIVPPPLVVTIFASPISGVHGAQRRNNCSFIVPQKQCTSLAHLLSALPYLGDDLLQSVDSSLVAGIRSNVYGKENTHWIIFVLGCFTEQGRQPDTY